ncbi:HVO_0234 family beta-propeller protein [Haloterrigena alkaliphila]|uniref:HVO-0234-like beta-propeller domain-containing protein n=1 Tax=Haloterrigena alkaliphila TaxID=2816475 RepID=A0A8A2VJN3_9EURY|nr:hypothetical protein [Haloterrigena alkaliphila]QSX00686.1 hypothetical protein J0X25_06935 [Haloterrigena alkaliphila]
MDSIEEKRVYGDREGALEVYVASSIGVVRVRVADEAVGEFGLCDRCNARDIAATEGTVAIATDEDVRVLDLERDPDAAGTDDAAFADTGFGPAVAVGADESGLIAAGPDGDVARLESAASSDGEWTLLESDGVATVRAIDGDLVGTDGGVYRVHDGALDHAGLTDVRDVSAAGVPLAATAEGLYKLGNGWMEALEGGFETVAADPRSERGRLRRAHAVSGETVYAYDADGDRWGEHDRSSAAIVGIGYASTVYAVTERGRFLSATPDDGTGPWRSQTLGVGDVTGLAVPAAE